MRYTLKLDYFLASIGCKRIKKRAKKRSYSLSLSSSLFTRFKTDQLIGDYLEFVEGDKILLLCNTPGVLRKYFFKLNKPTVEKIKRIV